MNILPNQPILQRHFLIAGQTIIRLISFEIQFLINCFALRMGYPLRFQRSTNVLKYTEVDG